MPTTRTQSTGICNFCNSEIDKGKMTTHLKHCKKRAASIAEQKKEEGQKENVRKSRMLHILVEGRYSPQYWLHLEIPAWAYLDELDGFLRNIWLECCGHLSEFVIGNNRYAEMGEAENFIYSPLVSRNSENVEDQAEQEEDVEEEEDESDEYYEPEKKSPEEEQAELMALVREQMKAMKIDMDQLPPKRVALVEQLMMDQRRFPSFRREEYDMEVKVGRIFKPGIKASYTYDFGSSTDLNVRVIAEREVLVVDDEEGEITILARNVQPAIVCDGCGKPATYISSYNNDALCDECLKKRRQSEAGTEEDEDDEEYYYEDGLLPVVNSPRMGVCGYTGRG